MRRLPQAFLLLLLLGLPACHFGNRTALSDATTTCYNPKALGPLVSRLNNLEFQPSTAMCLASRVLQGLVGRAAAAVGARLTRCHDGGGLQVTVFGGSVSCGRCVSEHKDRVCVEFPKHKWRKLECRHQAFPQLLENALNHLYPCPRRHVVVNRCVSSSASDFFINNMGRLMRDKSANGIRRADMIIVETSNNDVVDLKRKKGQRLSKEALIAMCTEVLVRQLLLLPQKPAILYLHAAWRDLNGAPPYHRDAAHDHAFILEYYNVPQVSAMAALQPLHSRARRDWIQNFYFCDKFGHLTAFGHKVVATLLLYNIRRDIELANHLTQFDHGQTDGPTPTEGLPPPLGEERKMRVYEGMMKGGIYEFIDLRNDTEAGDLVLSNLNGSFQFTEDVPGKPGLVALTVGAALLLNITHGLSPLRPLSPYLTSVGYLVSYAHMGQAALSIVTLNGSALGDVLHNITVDFFVEEQVSIYHSTSLSWMLNETVNATQVGLYVEVLSSAPPREENKVKLLDITTVGAG